MPQSIAEEALALISARRQQREAKENKESAPKIDTIMAAKMLRLCGIGAMDPVILCAYGKTNKFTPSRPAGQKNYDWQAVTKQAKNGERQWSVVEANLNDETPNLGFISCPGGTRVKCKQGGMTSRKSLKAECCSLRLIRA